MRRGSDSDATRVADALSFIIIRLRSAAPSSFLLSSPRHLVPLHEDVILRADASEPYPGLVLTPSYHAPGDLGPLARVHELHAERSRVRDLTLIHHARRAVAYQHAVPPRPRDERPQHPPAPKLPE
eukprot:31346-Pelagococcus_subviridis.AAC.3